MEFEEKAMAALRRLPALDSAVLDRQGVVRQSGDQRRTPFRGAQNSKAADVAEMLDRKIEEKYGSLRAAQSESPVKRVQFSNVHGLQAGVRADIVERKIREIAETNELEAPTMVRHKGKTYLLDGYHTLTALRLGGMRAVDAVVVSV